jgi:hypothetical protein
MNSLHLITDRELVQLYSEADYHSIARILKISSRQGRQDLKERVFRIARAYDAAFFEAANRPYDRETRKSLKNIRQLAQRLTLAIADSNGFARSDVAWALSRARDVRKLSTGEEVLPYGHPLSNEWIFDRESLAAFVAVLTSLDVHLEARMEKLAPGGRPRGPEPLAIRDLEELWKLHYGKAPYEKALGPFIELCELTLRPIATRHGKSPNIAAAVKNELYSLEPKPES